ncbi:hypothetical protein H4696_005170 [Amycolatopsis lexingtonensis]|uniref:Uncharacterized protein n=1 Tax=Amycolatopsis lexingtonensis TaxID=218822 RepID=A0ABR9I4H2_9PSEU|nr:hypothetical protein [Amycolatopsis lexingtonensis]MBE1498070.1 hypothetical protein [Amycolatopsis lexingtonensis]
MKVADAFARVVSSAERTRNTIRLLRIVILGAALLMAEFCAAVALLPAGVGAGLLAVVPGAGAWWWVKSRRQ